MRVAICSFLCVALGGSALHFKHAETTMVRQAKIHKTGASVLVFFHQEVLTIDGPGSQAADFIWGGGDLLLVGVTASCSSLLGTFDVGASVLLLAHKHAHVMHLWIGRPARLRKPCTCANRCAAEWGLLVTHFSTGALAGEVL